MKGRIIGQYELAMMYLSLEVAGKILMKLVDG